MFTADDFADLCPLPLRTWSSENGILWFIQTGDDVYESVTVAHAIVQWRQMRIQNFWWNIVIIFQHSLGMFKVIVMPVRIICANKEISKMLLNNSPSNVGKWIRLWTCETSQPMRISQISIDWKFNNIPSGGSCQMMWQQKRDVLQAHSVASAHRIASMPVRPVPTRPRAVLTKPLNDWRLAYTASGFQSK